VGGAAVLEPGGDPGRRRRRVEEPLAVLDADAPADGFFVQRRVQPRTGGGAGAGDTELLEAPLPPPMIRTSVMRPTLPSPPHEIPPSVDRW
jgi:hypothetical protein